LAYERRHELWFCDPVMEYCGEEDRERMRCVWQEDYGAGEDERRVKSLTTPVTGCLINGRSVVGRGLKGDALW
jgi:hypothetical protein